MIQTVEILCGPPGSGKSAWASLRAAAGWLVIDIDAIVAMFHGRRYALYHPALKDTYKRTERAAFTHAMRSGRNVVIDRTNHKRATRLGWLQLICFEHKPSTHKRLILFDERDATTLVNHRLGNLRGRTRDAWYQAITEILAEFEEPGYDEGFDALTHAPCRSNELELADAYRDVMAAIDDTFDTVHGDRQ